MQTAPRLPDRDRIRPAHGNHHADAPWAERPESALRAYCSGVATVLRACCSLVQPLYIPCTSLVHPLYIPCTCVGTSAALRLLHRTPASEMDCRLGFLRGGKARRSEERRVGKECRSGWS